MAEIVCPMCVGFLLASPIIKLILRPNIKNGMKVLDVGCSIGLFSLVLADMVGSKGKVICVDVQEKMIRSLEKRAQKAGLSNRIETRICHHDSLGLDDLKEDIDFAFASAVVHEVPDASRFFSEIYQTMKPTGRFLVIEPKGHVSEKHFEILVSAAEQKGFKIVERPKIDWIQVILFGKENVKKNI